MLVHPTIENILWQKSCNSCCEGFFRPVYTFANVCKDEREVLDAANDIVSVLLDILKMMQAVRTCLCICYVFKEPASLARNQDR